MKRRNHLYKVSIALAVCFATAATAVAQNSTDANSVSDVTPGQPSDPAAQFDLGMQYHTGDEVLQNYKQAAVWFARAASQGHAPSQNQLGQYLFVGHGVDADPATALQWLKAAASSGDPQYVFDYASALEGAPGSLADKAQAAQVYAQAAERGHLEAMVSLAVMFQNGVGVTQDLQRAKALYELAIAEGHPRAQNNLGLLYVRGDGVPQDYERAVTLFSEAAEQGLSVAMTNLGVMYENGFGVPLDEARAAALYRQAGGGDVDQTVEKADGPVYDPRLLPPDKSEAGLALLERGAKSGDPISQFQLGWVLLSQPSLTFSEQITAAGYMRASASAGLAPAMVNLAGLYAHGLGVPQDYVLARMWLIRAMGAGQTDTTGLSEQLALVMTPDQVDEAQRRAAQQR